MGGREGGKEVGKNRGKHRTRFLQYEVSIIFFEVRIPYL